MSLAETAQLAVNLHLGTSGSFKGATSEIAALERSTVTGQRSAGLLGGNLAKAGGAAQRFGGALGHAKSQLGSLVSGPLGLAGVTVGLLTFTGAIDAGIHKAQDFGAEVVKMSKLTGLSIETTSALASALDHYGVSADTALRLTGFLEKNVGLLAARKDGIANFEKAFSFSLRDANGHLKDANALILSSADYFNTKSIPATTKAAALAKLYGRSWQELIPFLSAGSKGIIAAEAAAKDFGLTLTKDNIGALVKMKAATRDWGDALGGLELQIGLALIPSLTELAKVATGFVSQNRDKIVGFFKDAAKFGQNLGSVVEHQVIPVFKGIAGAWGAVPKEVRDLVVAGFVGNKVIKWTFGFSPITFATDALSKGLGGILGGFLQKGGSFANPLWVAVVNGTPGPNTPIPLGPGQQAGKGILETIASAIILAAPAVAVKEGIGGSLDVLDNQKLLAAEKARIQELQATGLSFADAWKQAERELKDGTLQLRDAAHSAASALSAIAPGNRTPDFSRLPFPTGPKGNLTPEFARLTGAVTSGGKTTSAGLKNVRDTIEASKVAGVSAASRTTAAVAAARAKMAEAAQAAERTTQAVKNKKLAVTVHGSPITVNNSVSVSDVIKSRTTYRRAGNVYAL